MLDVAPVHHFHFFLYGTLQNKHTDMLESVIGLSWSEMSTSTAYFMCKRVQKGVIGLPWSEMSTSTLDFVCERVFKMC